MIALADTGRYVVVVVTQCIRFVMMNMSLIKKHMYALSAEKKKKKARSK